MGIIVRRIVVSQGVSPNRNYINIIIYNFFGLFLELIEFLELLETGKKIEDMKGKYTFNMGIITEYGFIQV